MTAEEAEILARNISVDCRHGIDLGYPCECCVATALRAAAEKARREALEEAARAIEALIPKDRSSIRCLAYGFAMNAVRALKGSK